MGNNTFQYCPIRIRCEGNVLFQGPHFLKVVWILAIFFITGKVTSQITGTPSSQEVCNGNTIQEIIFSGGPSGGNGNTGDYWITIYPWTGNLTSIGGASDSGTGNISPFIASNVTGSPVTVTITVTPITNYHHHWVQYLSVPQPPFDVTITVYLTPSAPTITPSPATACSGTSIQLSGTGAGGGDDYAWYNVAVGGVSLFTGNPFSTPPVALGPTTYYASIISSNGCEGNRTSVLVTGTASPTIITHPANSTICMSAPNTSFSVIASGSSLTYQWEVYPTPSGPWTLITDGGFYSGALTNTLNITGATLGMSGYQYRCQVSTGSCSVNSNSATLEVTSAPSITNQPIHDTVCVGTPGIFTVTATGSTYQWQISQFPAGPWTPVTNTGVYSGANTNTLVIATPNTAVPPNTRYFRVLASIPGCGSVASNSARLLVRPVATFITQPISDTVCESNQAQFSTSTSPPSLNRIWQISTDNGITWNNLVNGAPYSGVTTAMLTINPVSPVMNSYQYRCIATIPSSGCNTTSNPAILTVNTVPIIITQPVSQTICDGGNVTFTVTASGTPPLTYQWYHAGSPVSGATSNSITIDPVNSSHTGNYTVIITNGCGSVTSAIATLNLPSPLGAGHNTTSLTECSGYNPDALTLNNPIVNGGIPPYSYQWYLNGSPITGETSTSYDPPQLTTSGVYTYSCEVSDACGAVLMTSPKVINIVDDPIVTISGAGTYCANNSITLTAVITGGVGTFGYQWQSAISLSGPWNDITGATFSSFSPSSLVPGIFYYQVIINANGSGCNDPICDPVVVGIVDLPASPTLVPADPCEGSSPEFTAGGGSIYEFLIDGIVEQSASSDNTFQPSGPLSAGSNICVRSITNIEFDGDLSPDEWGAPLATSSGGAVSSFGPSNNLDAFYIRSTGGYLFMAIAGNIQDGSNNRVLVFIDSKTGGINSLNNSVDLSGAPYWSIENLGMNGNIIFDPGFNPDYILGINQANGGQVYFDLYDLQANTNSFLGTPGSNSLLGFIANSGFGDYTKGFEFALPGASLGNPAGTIKTFPMIVNSPPDEFTPTLLSNQFLTHADAGAGNYGNGNPVIDFGAALPDPIISSLSSEDCYTETCVTVNPLPSTSAIYHH